MNIVDELEIFHVLEKDVHLNKLSFNQDWRFFRGDIHGSEAADFDDSAWEIVHLPHIVRSFEKESGIITLLAESDGLKPATVEIISKPISKPLVPGKL
jgi:hypothetical protein